MDYQNVTWNWVISLRLSLKGDTIVIVLKTMEGFLSFLEVLIIALLLNYIAFPTYNTGGKIVILYETLIIDSQIAD